MKNKSLIQLWGKAGCGKTSTIKIIRHELEKKYINTHHIYEFPLNKGEIFEMFLCNGYTVGISSMGDDLTEYLKEHLLKYFLKCDIIIAASRIHNNVNRYLEEQSEENSFKRIKVTNYRVNSSDSDQFKFNQASAIHIVSIIDQIMEGKL